MVCTPLCFQRSPPSALPPWRFCKGVWWGKALTVPLETAKKRLDFPGSCKLDVLRDFDFDFAHSRFFNLSVISVDMKWKSYLFDPSLQEYCFRLFLFLQTALEKNALSSSFMELIGKISKFHLKGQSVHIVHYFISRRKLLYYYVGITMKIIFESLMRWDYDLCFILEGPFSVSISQYKKRLGITEQKPLGKLSSLSFPNNCTLNLFIRELELRVAKICRLLKSTKTVWIQHFLPLLQLSRS